MTDRPLLSRLYDPPPHGRLPGELERLHDGGLTIDSPRCYANFVESVDGVVALESRKNSGSVISGRNPADRFVMGLLRAFADVVLVGAGTVRAEGATAMWTPEFIYPAAAEDFAALRRQLGATLRPRLAILTRSGDLDPARPAMRSGPIILAPAAHADALKRKFPPPTEVIGVGPASPHPLAGEGQGGGIDVADVIEALRARGHQRILTEGGPTVFAELLGRRLVDELFVTVAPVLTGRAPDDDRLSLVEGSAFDPKEFRSMELRSLHRSGSHLFLRYRLGS